MFIAGLRIIGLKADLKSTFIESLYSQRLWAIVAAFAGLANPIRVGNAGVLVCSLESGSLIITEQRGRLRSQTQSNPA